jgi:2,3,4,5-tetrahydropyridine-2-carboxylate N-succinyltransferase
VHISGGVGLGGVLEPVQANPVIIEDNVFLGSRSIVVEGVRVQEGAVLGAGVVLTQSTKIIDVRQKTEKILKGLVPAMSIVIPGSVSKQFPSGIYQTPCALIIGSRSAQTDTKTSLNQALREFDIQV